MDQHGGKISVYSAGADQGCTFTILLPMFKSGNQLVEELNREEANMVNRRVFINKFLEKSNNSFPSKQSGNTADLSFDAPYNSPTQNKPRFSIPTHVQSKVVPGYIRRNTAFNQLGTFTVHYCFNWY